MQKQTNTICKPKRIRLFALIINCTIIMKIKSRFSWNVYALSDRIWCNKHLRHMAYLMATKVAIKTIDEGYVIESMFKLLNWRHDYIMSSCYPNSSCDVTPSTYHSTFCIFVTLRWHRKLQNEPFNVYNENNGCWWLATEKFMTVALTSYPKHGAIGYMFVDELIQPRKKGCQCFNYDCDKYIIWFSYTLKIYKKKTFAYIIFIIISTERTAEICFDKQLDWILNNIHDKYYWENLIE